ncbi:methyltransferase family protein [Roseibium sp. ROS1]
MIDLFRHYFVQLVDKHIDHLKVRRLDLFLVQLDENKLTVHKLQKSSCRIEGVFMAQPGGVSRKHERSLLQKCVFAALHLICVLLSIWLLLGGGWVRVGAWFGLELTLADPQRGLLLLACTLLYFARHLLTLFYLLARKVAFPEVFGLGAFIAFFEIGFLLLGSGAFRQATVPFSVLDGVALAMVVGGSFLNSWSELQRKWWKRDPAHHGQCYTGGLFASSMHINYFGDTVLFTGWALLTHNLAALAVPAFMAVAFVVFHIPALDAYLSRRYGPQFDAYAARTHKFIPFVY